MKIFTSKKYFLFRVCFVYGFIIWGYILFDEFGKGIRSSITVWEVLLIPIISLIIGFFILYPLFLVDAFCKDKTLEIINKYTNNKYTKNDLITILQELNKQNKIKEETYKQVYNLVYKDDVFDANI